MERCPPSTQTNISALLQIAANGLLPYSKELLVRLKTVLKIEDCLQTDVKFQRTLVRYCLSYYKQKEDLKRWTCLKEHMKPQTETAIYEREHLPIKKSINKHSNDCCLKFCYAVLLTEESFSLEVLFPNKLCTCSCRFTSG